MTVQNPEPTSKNEMLFNNMRLESWEWMIELPAPRGDSTMKLIVESRIWVIEEGGKRTLHGCHTDVYYRHRAHRQKEERRYDWIPAEADDEQAKVIHARAIEASEWLAKKLREIQG